MTFLCRDRLGHSTRRSPACALLVVPLLGTVFPWSSKAADILERTGLAGFGRIERGLVAEPAGTPVFSWEPLGSGLTNLEGDTLETESRGSARKTGNHQARERDGDCSINKRRTVGGYLFFSPFLIPLLFGAAIAGIGPIQPQGQPIGGSPCTDTGKQIGGCVCAARHVWFCYAE